MGFLVNAFIQKYNTLHLCILCSQCNEAFQEVSMGACSYHGYQSLTLHLTYPKLLNGVLIRVMLMFCHDNATLPRVVPVHVWISNNLKRVFVPKFPGCSIRISSLFSNSDQANKMQTSNDLEFRNVSSRNGICTVRKLISWRTEHCMCCEDGLISYEMKICLVNLIQWNLFITRSLGPWKLPCYIRFLIISG